MWRINNILLSDYGIIPGQVDREGIAVKGIFDLPKRLGTTYKDWDDSDSVEPYVGADEIFLEGRDIIFQGILEGTKSETEANIESLKTDISNLTNIAPFKTPYGTFCVYFKKITSKIYNGIATVLIEMREPEMGATCSVTGSITTYYSAIYSESTVKNNCGAGYSGLEVTLSSTLGQFTSTISQAAANQLAIDWVRETKQLNANNADFVTYCEVRPPIYYNSELTSTLQKNDCGPGSVGSIVSYTIPADTYSSDGKDDPTASQVKADAKAQAAMDAILTQAYANANGTCTTLPSMVQVSNTGQVYSYRYQLFKIGESIVAGTIYNVQVYSKLVSYTTGIGDTKTDVLNGLVSAVNAVTEAQWDAFNSAPLSGTVGFKPLASITFSGLLSLRLNYQNQFISWVTNP